MRDDNHSRNYPPNDPSRRAPAGAGNAQGGDPLAELARLIGQNDPFSDFGRDQGRAPAPAHNSRRPDPNPNPTPSDWQAHPAPYRDAPQARQAPQQAPQYVQDAPAHDAFQGAPGEQHGYPDSFPSEQVPDGQYAPQNYAPQNYAPQDYAPPPRGFDPQPSRGFDPQQSRGFDPQQFDPQQSRGFDPQQFDPQQTRGYDPQQSRGFDPQQFDPQQRHGEQRYGDQRGYAPQNNSFQPPQGRSDSYYRGAPHDEDMYEDQPRARRRGGMLTVMAVLALAVIGTAGAFGYRAVFSNAGAVLTPPTIRADAGPNKVAPTSQTSDASGKLIYDRVGEKGQPERLVSREEQPADIKTAAPAPRVVLSSGMPNPIAPVPTTPVPPSAPAFAAPPAPAASAANASTEPKKVRTLTIRPDQPAAETTSAAPAAAPARAVPPVEPVPATTTVRTTTIRPQATQQVAQNDPNAPLSLTPNSSAQRSTMRTASAPAAQPVATTSGSAYAVQVTSQRSEAEAQSSYQALQAKYPNVLGNRQAAIRRADLGDKGTYYRAQVPFGSQSEASEFCASLRAAGGQCVVQRN